MRIRRTTTAPSQISPTRTDRHTYTVSEVATLVGISRSTAYECVRRGEIPSRRFGRRIVVLRNDVDLLLARRSSASEPTRLT